MRRRELLAAGGTVAAIGLAGCIGGSADEGEDGGGTDDGSGSASVEQVTEGDGTRRSVVVTSTGEVESEPDLALLRVGVESRADTAGEARNRISEGAEELIAALTEYGIAEDDITTQRYWVRDRIDRRAMEEDGVRPDDPETRQEYTYYQGSHTFEVKVRDVEAVGEVIDVAVDGGADEVGRVTFTLSEETRADLREEALRQAIESAREEADLVAGEVGAEIVEATVVDASNGQVSPVRREFAMAGGDAAATPTAAAPPTGIEHGDVTVSARVRIEYEMA